MVLSVVWLARRASGLMPDITHGDSKCKSDMPMYGKVPVNNSTIRQPLADFVAEVAIHARKPQQGKSPGAPNPVPPVIWPIYSPGRQCAHVWTKNARKGQRCGCWAMRGAKMCYRHGGCREVPKHFASKQLYRSGALDHEMARRAARHELAQPEMRQWRDIARAEMAARDIPTWLHLIAIDGAKAAALADTDNGRAFRRWIATLNARPKATHTPIPPKGGKDTKRQNT